MTVTDHPLPFSAVLEMTDNGSRTLVAGNGLSIAADTAFDYRQLVEIADFGEPTTKQRVLSIFENLGSSDFESVLDELAHAARTVDLYEPDVACRLTNDADLVRESLGAALARVHPAGPSDIGEAALKRGNAFLEYFEQVFTLSYDALLYWTINRNQDRWQDGFRLRDGELVHLRTANQNVHWLHGALHLWEGVNESGNPFTRKTRWDSNGPLVEFVNQLIADRHFPLMVIEGTWTQKLNAIRRSPYLLHCLRSLESLSEAVVTFGWALSPNDRHLVHALARSGTSKLFVGIYPAATQPEQEQIASTCALLRVHRSDLEVHYWDTSSAAVW